MLKLTRLFILILLSKVVVCQNIDSLKLALKMTKNDTTRILLIKQIGETEEIFRVGYWDSLASSCEALITKCKETEKIFYNKNLGYALNNVGYVYDEHGDFQMALKYYQKSFFISEKINNQKGMALALNNIGTIYENYGDIPKALDYYHKSLKIRDNIKDLDGVAVCLNNIGLVYFKQGNSKKALEYYSKSYKLMEQFNDKPKIAIALSNIGLIYQKEKNYKVAKAYYEKSLGILVEINDKHRMVSTLNNLAGIYSDEKKYTKSLDLHTKNLILENEIQSNRKASTLNNMAIIYLIINDLNQAKKYCEQSLVLAKESGNPEFIQNSSKTLSDIYFKLGNYKGAYQMQVLYKTMADSLNNDGNRKASIQKELQYNYEKKVTEDSLTVALERTAFNIKSEKEKNQRYFLYGGLVLVLLFAGFMYNRFKITKKQNLIINNQKQEVEFKNEEITHQKHLVDEKQKEIIDSINYAKRIQQAVLTGEDVWNKISPEHFILFKPKDIVSGDFYWAYNTPNGRSIFALADCTGHGVPGGFMSMLGNSFLNEIVVENKNFKADEILNKLRTKIITALEQKGHSEQKDGMDISLCVWNKIDNTLEFAGANNPLWILRGEEISEYKADKMPIGTYLEIEKPFTSSCIQLQPQDIIYLSTDGYADQFGGPKGKKFKYKALLELLMTNHKLEMTIQKDKLEAAFMAWKNEYDQVDDVAVIGIRIV